MAHNFKMLQTIRYLASVAFYSPKFYAMDLFTSTWLSKSQLDYSFKAYTHASHSQTLSNITNGDPSTPPKKNALKLQGSFFIARNKAML